MFHKVIAVVSVTIVAVVASIAYTEHAFAAAGSFPVYKLNSFYVTNETNNKPLLIVVGLFTNTNKQIEEEVDISLAMYNARDEIVGTQYLYNYDVKPGNANPFKFRITPAQIEDNDFSNVVRYTVLAE